MRHNRGLRGEYWILPSGNLLDASGHDANKRNHSHHALAGMLRRLRRLVRNGDDEILKQLVDSLPATYDEDTVMFRVGLLDAADSYLRNHDADPRYDEIDDCLADVGVDDVMRQTLWGYDLCPRDWVREHLGWISVADGPVRLQIGLHGLTDKKVARLRDGLWDIVNREGCDPTETPFMLVIYDNATKRRYPVSWDCIQDGLASSLHPLESLTAAASGY